MKKYTQKELEQIFENRFDCYADTTDESVVMAMSKKRYIEVLKELKILNIQNVTVAKRTVCECTDLYYRYDLGEWACKDCRKVL